MALRPLLALLMGVALFPAAVAADSSPRRVAVLELDVLGGDAALGASLSQLVLDEVGRLPGLKVIGESEIGTMLSFEEQRMLSGCDESADRASRDGAFDEALNASRSAHRIPSPATQGTFRTGFRCCRDWE